MGNTAAGEIRIAFSCQLHYCLLLASYSQLSHQTGRGRGGYNRWRGTSLTVRTVERLQAVCC